MRDRRSPAYPARWMGTLRWAIPAGQQERYPPTPAAVGEYGASSKREMRAVAAGTGMELLAFDAAGPDDYPSAFAAMRAAGVQALAITSSPTFNRDAGLLARLRRSPR